MPSARGRKKKEIGRLFSGKLFDKILFKNVYACLRVCGLREIFEGFWKCEKRALGVGQRKAMKHFEMREMRIRY